MRVLAILILPFTAQQLAVACNVEFERPRVWIYQGSLLGLYCRNGPLATDRAAWHTRVLNWSNQRLMEFHGGNGKGRHVEGSLGPQIAVNQKKNHPLQLIISHYSSFLTADSQRQQSNLVTC